MSSAELPHEKTAMAIFPSTVGFGWILFDGPLSPVDWAVSTVAASARGDQERNRRCLVRIEEHVLRYRPAVMVFEEFDTPRRSERIRSLCKSIVALATVEGLQVRIVSRAQIAACFADARARTRHEIATVVASYLREIRVRLPDKRKIWDGEKPDAALMNAAALLIVHYATR